MRAAEVLALQTLATGAEAALVELKLINAERRIITATWITEETSEPTACRKREREDRSVLRRRLRRTNEEIRAG